MNLPKSDFTEHLLHSQQAWQGDSLLIRQDTVRLVDGSETSREYIDRPAAAMALAYRNGTIMMVYQYRHPVRTHVLEFPAGKVDPGEDPEAAARRELREEAGIDARRLEKIFTLLPSVATSSEILHLYLAEDLQESEQDLDDGEFLERIWLSLKEADAMVARGEIQDTKSILGIQYLTRRFALP